jgi:hypothetical protein
LYSVFVPTSAKAPTMPGPNVDATEDFTGEVGVASVAMTSRFASTSTAPALESSPTRRDGVGVLELSILAVFA